MLLKTVDYLIYQVFKLEPNSKLTDVMHFFIYDSVKIMLLLFIMIAIIAFLRTFIPERSIKKWLQSRGIIGNFFASMFGAVTPFCSCSSIPIFISMIETGIPLGVTFSFLITSPLVNEYLVVLMIGFFGWKITILYVLSGILIGVFCGFALGKMKLEKYIEQDFQGLSNADKEIKYETFFSRIRFALKEAVQIVKKIWFWILVGVSIGAIIHNYVPQSAIQSVVSRTGIFSVPIAAIMGVPLYGSCAAIVPIAVVLFQKGIPLGTALSFMMATAALSLPEAIILRRAIKLPLIAIFFMITTLGIILIGYLFNLAAMFLK